MKSFLKDKSDNFIIVLISVITAVSSQFYINVFTDSFRISTAVIFLPLLLLTAGKNISDVKICAATAVAVILLRCFIHSIYYGSFAEGFMLYYPSAVFYIFYGFLFTILCNNKHTASYKNILPAMMVSDFLANLCELCITGGSTPMENVGSIIVTLALIAFVRSVVAWTIFVMAKQYRTLLQKEEHEKRYQRLFVMTTGLKNEIYFMKKNSEEIERVMGIAYRLYEKLADTSLDAEIKNMSLELAKDVHEIKKDYIRIIKGIENEISEEDDEKQMKFSDILHILKDTTHHLLEEKDLKIQLDFICQDDFVTNEHYELMNILKNLVTNATEAIETGEKGDKITIEQGLVDNQYIITVKDNGPGISKRHLPNIFKMGYSTKFDYVTGNIYRGVGLCGVKSTIEERFGGSIEVASVFGNGTDFTIKIPKYAITLQEKK